MAEVLRCGCQQEYTQIGTYARLCYTHMLMAMSAAQQPGPIISQRDPRPVALWETET